MNSGNPNDSCEVNLTTQPLTYDRWPPQYPERIQLYSINSPNGIKISTALEETGLPYEPHFVDIRSGDQFSEAYKSLSPNSKIPAIIDPRGPGGRMISIMESGAILIYLAEKSGKLLPADPIQKNECLQWLFFQVGHIGPMFGQFEHFYRFAGKDVEDPYARDRYCGESQRLLGVLDERLSERDFIAGPSYSIADIATFPWVRTVAKLCRDEDHLGLADFRAVAAWFDRCMERPASQAGISVCAS